MNFEGGHHLKVIRSIGVSLGLWPYRCTILGKMNGAVALTIIFLYIVAQLAVFITHEFSGDLFLNAVTGIEPPAVFVIKYSYFMWKMNKLHSGVKSHKTRWGIAGCSFLLGMSGGILSLAASRSEPNLEPNATRAVRWNCLLLLCIPMGLPFLPLLKTLDNQTRTALLPIKVEYFVDQDRYFYWIALHCDITILLGIFILFVTESTGIHFLIHACALLEITGDRIERLLERSVPTAVCDKTYLSMHSQLVATIKMHQHVLEFIGNINNTFLSHYCIISVFGVVSLSINFYILAREMVLMKVTGEMVTAVIQIVIALFYMGCGCYGGQVLLDKGHEVFMKTCYARWHEAPLSVQKMCLYTLQRSMLPTCLELGGLYTVSFEFFCKLLNATISYFMVIYSTA